MAPAQDETLATRHYSLYSHHFSVGSLQRKPELGLSGRSGFLTCKAAGLKGYRPDKSLPPSNAVKLIVLSRQYRVAMIIYIK